MKESVFETLISAISAKLNIMEELSTAITTEVIHEQIDELAKEYKKLPNFEMTDADVSRLKFYIGSMFNVRVGEAAISLHNPEVSRWFDSKKADIEWVHWKAYKSMLKSQGRSKVIIDANEEVINDILDYSGDPSTPGPWARKGLVMGNVQSGKTQNYIGLINKAIDSGYKTVILLGGHLNDLRKQTQERVDEGVLGRKSKHLVDAQNTAPAPIGVGIYGENSINTGTTTVGDFNKNFADRLGFKLSGEDPVIFTIKKHTGVMEKLYKWIKEFHYLDPGIGKRLSGPLLLIDDEADYASINTKHHAEEVTRTNDYIRDILSLFERNTYVGYTATPFANIFIDPDKSTYSDKDDLFPSDFMIKIPVPDNYMGQDFFFGQSTGAELEEGAVKANNSSTIAIKDYGPVYELKKTDEILALPGSLEKAVRSFVLVIAIRSLRGERFSHNTMLVNISHLKVHQNKLEFLIAQYHKKIDDALEAYSGLGPEEARKVSVLNDLEGTFKELFSVEEEYEHVFERLREASGKIKVWAINQNNKKDEKDLNYSTHKEHGLCAIVIGGHKLSRGLTLEGLSISYFARNSKAYDTLMQMCRWFGYRPKYADLCRVFLPQDSIDWYSFISDAIRELYQELALMSIREQTPSEFGLKVREHPGAMVITAKNKMGIAESEIRSQDLWGQIQRRFRFRADAEINRLNLEFTKSYIQKLTDQKSGTDDIHEDQKSGAWIYSNVQYDDIIEYVERMELPEDDLGDVVLIDHLRKMRDSGLELPRVVLFNQRGSRVPKWEKNELSEPERAFINEEFCFSDQIKLALPKRLMNVSSDIFKVSSVSLGNPDDEKLFLKDTERDLVKNAIKEKFDRAAVSFDYLCSDDRGYPGLIIYNFGVAVRKQGEKKATLGHGKMPTVGYTISLPRSESLKGMTKKEIDILIRKTKHSYQVNKVHMQLQKLSAYEDYDDDE